MALQMLRHFEIILRRMKPRPRQQEAIPRTVVRLMLVPEESEF